MDRIIFGDNQFFGINHISEEKAQDQAERFKDINTIIKVIDTAYDCGIHAFMFTPHDRVADICDHFRKNPDKYADLRLYPALPYAHKYANAVNERGIIGALNDFIFADRSATQVLGTLARGAISVIKQDPIDLMKLLIDAEMRMFRDLNVRVVFLQNVTTDLLLGLGLRSAFVEFASYVRRRYSPAKPGFITVNLAMLVHFLLECGIENPIVCSTMNKIGFHMNPDMASYEETIRTKPFTPVAMSILASGALPPREAVEYVCGLKQVQSIVFGASSKPHILETKELIEQYSV